MFGKFWTIRFGPEDREGVTPRIKHLYAFSSYDNLLLWVHLAGAILYVMLLWGPHWTPLSPWRSPDTGFRAQQSVV